jgi:uncharacterized BrkB/YihY/UPF0761 family membrane protein
MTVLIWVYYSARIVLFGGLGDARNAVVQQRYASAKRA